MPPRIPVAGWILIATATACLAMTSCAGRDDPSRDGPVDVLLVTVDTARADKFSYTGASTVETPRIDSLRTESTAFTQAISPTPITLPAHTTILTGQLPLTHGVRNNGTYRLRDEAVTLAEVLRSCGYRTGAFVAAAVLDRKYGLDQGFEHYDDDVYHDKFHPERRAEIVVRRALDWLTEQQGAPTFVWVHLFDPHAPYDPPEPERSRFAAAPYDGEIAYVDRMVGGLLEGYRNLGRLESAVIVFTADHGESLGEHGEETHGTFLYDATVHVPLLIRAPRTGRGRAVASQVQLADVFPTVLELLRIPAPPGLGGRSVVPLMRGESVPAAMAYLETRLPLENYGWSDLRGIRGESWKLISGVAHELYDLEHDPRESHDLADAQPDRVSAMARALTDEFSESGQTAAEQVELDPETRARLSALGYLTMSPDAGENESTGLPDPRERIHLIRAKSIAAEQFDRGFHAAALGRSKAILAEDPSNSWVAGQYLKMLIGAGETEEAERQARALITADPGDGWAKRVYGRLLENSGRRAEALEQYVAAARSPRPDEEARLRRWEILLEEGRADQVALEAGEYHDADPENGAAFAAMVRARWGTSDPSRVVEELHAAVERLPGDAPLAAALGNYLLETGDPFSALPLQETAQSLDSSSEWIAIDLARTLAAVGRSAEVRHLLQNMRKRGMLDPEGWYRLAEACLELGDLPCASRAMLRVSALVHGRLDPWFDTWCADTAREDRAERRRRGELLYLGARFDEAADLFAAGARSVPGDAVWRYQQGLAQEGAGRFDEALASYIAAVEIDASFRRARDRRWRLLSRLGRTGPLEDEILAALAADPRDGAARVALVRSRSKDPATTMRALQTQLDELPGDAALTTAMASLWTPSEQAERFFRAALRARPDDGEAALGLGRALLATEKVDEALATLGSLYQRSPPTLEVSALYGEALARRREFERLREVLTLMMELGETGGRGLPSLDVLGSDVGLAKLMSAEALSVVGTTCWDAGGYWNSAVAYALGSLLVPSDAGFHYNLGLAWERVGDFEEALVAFERTLELDAGFPRVGHHLEFARKMTGHRKGVSDGSSRIRTHVVHNKSGAAPKTE